ncbi:hypothetical protein DUI87_05003 [Hirundo rustica rustica]|uniref:Reverse transcriptase domain-containing protein n=1 Tax=Hirundo rustica rustica TaxID=333673 RepID=A0A3M0KY99_HIRRU|nr:hypothetical protein DUI87_05003 [Hirundo rustica rustica]
MCGFTNTEGKNPLCVNLAMLWLMQPEGTISPSGHIILVFAYKDTSRSLSSECLGSDQPVISFGLSDFALDIRMPAVTPKQSDTYLCMSVPLPVDDEAYVVDFKPHASMDTVHHMLLFGCNEPSSAENYWDCDEGTCKDKSNILYAWARNAPPTRLPKGVGFRVGGETGSRYFVLQVHYGDISAFRGQQIEAREQGDKSVTQAVANPTAIQAAAKPDSEAKTPAVAAVKKGKKHTDKTDRPVDDDSAIMKWDETEETVLDMAKKLRTYADAMHGPTHARIAALETQVRGLADKMEENHKELKEDILQISAVQVGNRDSNCRDGGVKQLNTLPGLSENPSAVGLLKVEEQQVPIAISTVHRRQYRTTRDAVIPIHKMIRELESQGVVSKTHSPFNSPIWPVRKSDGEWRLTVDYRALNEVTPPLSTAVPDMLELQYELESKAAKCCATIDIANTFFSIPLAAECRPQFAFTWRGVQYTWNRLPQGWKHSPTICHGLIQAALEKGEAPEHLQYIDDIIVWGNTAMELFEKGEKFIQILLKAGFAIRRAKLRDLLERSSF